jgi:hypothetical protein
MKERLVQGALEALEYERGSGYRYILAYDYCRSERAGKGSLIFRTGSGGTGTVQLPYYWTQRKKSPYCTIRDILTVISRVSRPPAVKFTVMMS